MASTKLTKSYSTTGNRKIYTLSVWVKFSGFAAATLANIGPFSGDNEFRLTRNASGTLEFYDYGSGAYRFRYRTHRLFRDNNAFYHIVIAVDTTQAGAADRVKIYVNGVQETSFDVGTHPSQNFDTAWGIANNYTLAATESGNFLDGVLSHFHYADGSQLAPTVFGEYDANGVWKINTSPSFTPGTNGFTILKDGNTVTDQSSNSNNWTVSGTLTKTEDNPSNVFATMNSLIPSALQYANGNTDVQQTTNVDWEATKGTLGFTQGKYYWEIKISSNSGDPWDQFHGIAGENAITSGATYDATPSVIFAAGGTIDVDGTTQQSGLGQSSDGDIIGIAVDADNSNIDFYRNGTQVGTTQALSSNTGYWLPFSGFAGNRTCQVNFGNGYFGTTAVASAGTNASNNGIFEYDVPTGYTALSTKGLNL